MRYSVPYWVRRILCSNDPENETSMLDSKKIVRELTKQKIVIVYKNKDWKNDLIRKICSTGLTNRYYGNDICEINGTGISIRFINLDAATSARGIKPNRIFYEPLLECKYAADRLEYLYKNDCPPLPVHRMLYAYFDPSKIIESNPTHIDRCNEEKDCLNDFSPELDEFLNNYRGGGD